MRSRSGVHRSCHFLSEFGNGIKEEGSFSIVVFNNTPVGLAPPIITHFGVTDLLIVFPFHLDRDRKPSLTLRRGYLVAAAPVAFGILHIIEEDEAVRLIEDVKIALPRDIA